MKYIGNSTFEDSTAARTQVFKELEKAILSGELAPGDSLVEMKLAAQMGVSRTPVREALLQLELERLVKHIPNRGAVVVGISEKDIEDIYTLRMRIEGLAARWAAEKITDEEIEDLRSIVELQEFYLQKGDAIQTWHLDSRFHEIVNTACRSGPLRHTLSSFHNYIQSARRISLEIPDRAAFSVSEHRKILEAISKRDMDLSEQAMITHISNARDKFLSSVRTQMNKSE
ncbi:MAG: GntR family transcriptional regulator [Clostridiales bacterium]|nr:GntR family transcriptional regulator [Clostridiales bacterium]